MKPLYRCWPGDTFPVDCFRSWGVERGFHDKSRCGYRNAGTELKTSEEQKTERTDLELLTRKTRCVKLRFEGCSWWKGGSVFCIKLRRVNTSTCQTPCDARPPLFCSRAEREGDGDGGK